MKTRITICITAVLALLLTAVGCALDTSTPKQPPWLVMVGAYQTHQSPKNNFEIFLDGDWTMIGGWEHPFKNGDTSATYYPAVDQTRLKYWGDDIYHSPPIIRYFGFGWNHSGYPGTLASGWSDDLSCVYNLWQACPAFHGYKVDIEDMIDVSLTNSTDDIQTSGVTIEVWDVGYMFFDEQQPHEDMTEEGMPPDEFFTPDPDLFPQPFTLPPGESASFDVAVDGEYIVLFFSSSLYDPEPGAQVEELKVWTQTEVVYSE